MSLCACVYVCLGRGLEYKMQILIRGVARISEKGGQKIITRYRY